MRVPAFFALALTLSAPLLTTGCSASPPAHWAQGGAPLAIGRARWERGADTVDITDDGRVLVDGDHMWTIDASGRVMDPDRDPVALLFQDGQLVGNDNDSLGRVGVENASAPGSGEAWLSLLPSGQVVFYDPEGERRAGGGWAGCQGPVYRTCTLVTHLVRLREWRNRSRGGLILGVGIGVHR